MARREDGPTGFDTPFALMRDAMAARWPGLSGRWMRQLYGFSIGAASAKNREGINANYSADGAFYDTEDPQPSVDCQDIDRALSKILK